ncbi:hypothetical protein SS50377_28434 [Spironucleus salmonicida]|uniref:Uncharacterized protein n=1 Tax=Spironucleus salmonicida TaxID=348837 RepID=V6LHP2_9EUKA|nr:hypothetical protein SS50377_28434 [Spironucleus salmonicida]|eukprot:EST43206.1 Hypothetical protein SS50377_17149 [Spironucleus salmonicida]
MNEYANDSDGKNVYNRKPNSKPIIRVGNWVEELVIFEEMERRRLNNEEDPSAQSCIVDPTVDPKDHYTTTNSIYGKFSKRKDGNTVYREPGLSIVKEEYVNPREAKRIFQQSLYANPGGHDVLNTDILKKEKMMSTMNVEFQKVEYEPTTYGSIPQDTISVHNCTGNVVFKRSGAFTKPIEDQ